MTLQTRLTAITFLVAGLLLGYFVYQSETLARKKVESPLAAYPFKLGLDLSGGTELTYDADLSAVAPAEASDALNALRDVIERRINIFGVAEPVVRVEQVRTENSSSTGRLSIELPGVTNVAQAVAWVGQTPALDFRVEKKDGETGKLLDAIRAGTASSSNLSVSDVYVPTLLTGRFLKKAQVQFNQTTGAPTITLSFNDEGAKLFGQITEANIGRTVAIYLDGAPISTPVVREAIRDGQAQITGTFTLQEAKELVGRLNSGALPVPITLLASQSVGGTLGARALDQGVQAALFGLLFVALFFVLWYRVPGIVAVFSLGFYFFAMLTLFKFFGVTLTAAGIAGFIISIGVAVDANVLIFERMREERLRGKGGNEALSLGFSRAWTSIRDSNISSLITALVLFWFGTSLIKGFALTFALGILVSLFTAVLVTRVFLRAIGAESRGGFLFGSGFSKK
jgi:protein-export membrane protein SecD